MSKVAILGAMIDNVFMVEAMKFIDDSVKSDGFHQIITLNAEILYGAYYDPKLMDLINNVSMVTPDGSGIVWAADRLGHPLKERVSGIDILQELLKVGSIKGYKLFIFGANEEVNQKACDRIMAKFPTINIVGRRNGYFSDAETPAIVEQIKESGADILIAAMGAPKQDMWLRDNGPLTGVKVGIGVGGSLDVISGTVKRAPVIFQKLKLEWFYRLIKEPWRYKRMMVLPKFVRMVKKIAKNK